MSKKITPSELTRTIKDLDIIEIVIESISRDESTSNKKNKLLRYLKTAQAHIDDQRDVYLVSIKVK